MCLPIPRARLEEERQKAIRRARINQTRAAEFRHRRILLKWYACTTLTHTSIKGGWSQLHAGTHKHAHVCAQTLHTHTHTSQPCALACVPAPRRNLFKNVLRARAAEREEAALRVLEAQWVQLEVADMGQEDVRSHAMR